jgi:hypothetical protein
MSRMSGAVSMVCGLLLGIALVALSAAAVLLVAIGALCGRGTAAFVSGVRRKPAPSAEHRARNVAGGDRRSVEGRSALPGRA